MPSFGSLATAPGVDSVPAEPLDAQAEVLRGVLAGAPIPMPSQGQQ